MKVRQLFPHQIFVKEKTLQTVTLPQFIDSSKKDR